MSLHIFKHRLLIHHAVKGEPYGVGLVKKSILVTIGKLYVLTRIFFVLFTLSKVGCCSGKAVKVEVQQQILSFQ